MSDALAALATPAAYYTFPLASCGGAAAAAASPGADVGLRESGGRGDPRLSWSLPAGSPGPDVGGSAAAEPVSISAVCPDWALPHRHTRILVAERGLLFARTHFAHTSQAGASLQLSNNVAKLAQRQLCVT
jgi:hypothetical protein